MNREKHTNIKYSAIRSDQVFFLRILMKETHRFGNSLQALLKQNFFVFFEAYCYSTLLTPMSIRSNVW